MTLAASRRGLVALMIFGAAAFSFALAASAEARTINVPGANDKTIQQAENRADPGDTIAIRGRRFAYNENVVVDTNRLTFVGRNRNGQGARVDGTGVHGNQHDLVFDINANGVALKNLRLLHGNGVDCDGDRCKFIDLIVNMSDQGGDCLEIDGRKAVVKRSRLEGCDDNAIDIDGNRFLIDRNQILHGDNNCIEIEGNNGRIDELNEIRICEDGNAVDLDGDGNLIRNNFGKSTDNQVFEIDGKRNRVINNRAANSDGSSGCIDIDGIGSKVKRNVTHSCSYGYEISGENPKVIKNYALNTNEDDGIDVQCRDQSGGAPEASACKRAVVKNNTNWNSGDDDDGFVISDSSTDGGMLIKDNISRNSYESGYDIDVDQSTITGNVSRRDGAEGNEPGYEICGARNKIVGNAAYNSGEDGIQVESCGNRNKIKGNLAKYANLDGIHLEGSSNAVIRGNWAISNLGDGIENDGDDTDIIANTSRDNRRGADCTNDGTIDVKRNNRCADGSNFKEPGNINRVPRRLR